MITRYILADTLLVAVAFLLSYRRQVLRRQHSRIESDQSLLRVPLIMTIDVLILAITVEVSSRYWWISFIVWLVLNAVLLWIWRMRARPSGEGTT
jgi:hypothetical protein